MKKVLSVLLTSAFTYNMTATPFAMENKDWEQSDANRAKANTYKLKLPELTGLFVLAGTLIQVSSTPSVAPTPSPFPPVPNGAPLPFVPSPESMPVALPYCVPQSHADNASWSNFEIFTASSGSIALLLSSAALGYTIFYNYFQGPIAKLETRVDALDKGPNSLVNKTITLENTTATLNANLSNLGSKKVLGQPDISLNKRLDDFDIKIKNHSDDLDGDGQNKKGLKNLVNGDPKSTDPLEKNGLYKGVKKIIDKLPDYGSKSDLEKYVNQHTHQIVTNNLSTLLEEKINLVKKISEENQTLAEKIKQLEEENKSLRNTGGILTSSPQIQSLNSLNLPNKKK